MALNALQGGPILLYPRYPKGGKFLDWIISLCTATPSCSTGSSHDVRTRDMSCKGCGCTIVSTKGLKSRSRWIYLCGKPTAERSHDSVPQHQVSSKCYALTEKKKKKIQRIPGKSRRLWPRLSRSAPPTNQTHKRAWARTHAGTHTPTHMHRCRRVKWWAALLIHSLCFQKDVFWSEGRRN